MKRSITKSGICTAVTAAAITTVAGIVPVAALAAPALPELPQKLAGKTIFLDPGHQGPNHSQDTNKQVSDGRGGTKECQTTGMTTLHGIAEHTITWNVAQLVRTSLEGLGAHVVLSRPDDTGWGGCIDERAKAANASGADVAVSIHADSGPADGHGFHLIVPQLPVADAKVNEVQSGPGLAASKAMRDTYVQSGYQVATYNGAVDGLQTRSDIAGPALTTVPDVFLEMGNGANADDAQQLESPEGQLKHAVTITTGIASYLLGVPVPGVEKAADPGTQPGQQVPAQAAPAPAAPAAVPAPEATVVPQAAVPVPEAVAPQAPAAAPEAVAPPAPEAAIPQAVAPAAVVPHALVVPARAPQVTGPAAPAPAKPGQTPAQPGQTPAQPGQTPAPPAQLPGQSGAAPAQQNPAQQQPGDAVLQNGLQVIQQLADQFLNNWEHAQTPPQPGIGQKSVPQPGTTPQQQGTQPGTSPQAVQPKPATPAVQPKPATPAVRPVADLRAPVRQSPATPGGSGNTAVSPGTQSAPGTQALGTDNNSKSNGLGVEGVSSLVQMAVKFFGPLAKMLTGDSGLAPDLLNLAYSVVSVLSSTLFSPAATK
ncbi:N-acetylmuramoyl-L-alanine amidase [Nocardia tengchongensis]|uniref:N-acetylmuramoyl-L-alanine amidase n=1 Tax=Nocardia tengchongensis TaxID=2055889 RepID=A0ABX8CVT9_9NOCA|nr:N-acetylmuramoyl-L-alanine amidase [Nocardia tengchongensis]